MRKRVLALITAGLLAAGAGSAFANDQAAYPENANENAPEGHCQELGDEADDGNSDEGLEVADLANDIIEIDGGQDQDDETGDDDCDNSGGRRP